MILHVSNHLKKFKNFGQMRYTSMPERIQLFFWLEIKVIYQIKLLLQQKH